MGEKRTPQPRHGEPDCQRRAADLKCRLQQEDFKKEIGIKSGGPRYYLLTMRYGCSTTVLLFVNCPSPVLIEPGQRTVAQPPTEFGTPSRVPRKELQMELTKVKARRRGLV
jgi:hypothetical protein